MLRTSSTGTEHPELEQTHLIGTVLGHVFVVERVAGYSVYVGEGLPSAVMGVD